MRSKNGNVHIYIYKYIYIYIYIVWQGNESRDLRSMYSKHNNTCLVSVFWCKWRGVLSHLAGGSLREKAYGDRREWRIVLSHLTAREGTWRSSEVVECFITLDWWNV